MPQSATTALALGPSPPALLSFLPIDSSHSHVHPIRSSPFAALLLSNPVGSQSSNTRDSCAAERTFLSWLRLSVYMAVVSIAILLNFHLKQNAGELEKKWSFPLGVGFWILSLSCLVCGAVNYFVALKKFASRAALVHSGWGTRIVFGVVAAAIIGVCVLFIATHVTASK